MGAHWPSFTTSGVIGGSFLNSLPFPWVIFRKDLSLCVLFAQCLLDHLGESPPSKKIGGCIPVSGVIIISQAISVALFVCE